MGRLGYARKLAREFLAFAAENKAWWLVPLVAVLALAAVLAMSATTSAPFVYSLF
jgi:hypothetical protein